MIGAIDNKTVVFKCPECGRTMMGSTIVNRVKMRWKHYGTKEQTLKPVYICTDCLNKAAEVKLEQKKINKIYGGK